MDNIKITIEREGEKLELTTHNDSNVYDWVDIFKTIMTWLTFHRDLIADVFKK